MIEQPIAYLADASSVHTQRWVAYFVQRGYRAHVFSFLPGEIPGAQVHRFDAGPVRAAGGNWRYLLHLPALRRHLGRLRPSLVHAHYLTSYGFLGALSGYRPFVLTVWGSDVLISPQKSRLIKWLTGYVLKRADLITCDAEHLVDRMVELGADREKIRVIYFGTDTQTFTPQCRQPGFGEELQLGSDSLLVISLRRLDPVYDVGTLIRAIPRVLDQVPNARFLIAGDGEQREELQQLAASLGVGDSVRFVGLLSSEQLPRYLASADVYVSTALSDGGLAASTAEAMACGLPVVITRFGDNEKWVTDGVGGFVIPPGEPGILAERLIYLLKNQEVRRRFGQVNRRTIEEKNNYHKEMAQVDRLYQEVSVRTPVRFTAAHPSPNLSQAEDSDPPTRGHQG